MALTRIPKIDEFPSDGRFWRVDWLGALEPNPEITTEPFIQVLITPFTSSPHQLRAKKLSSIRATNPEQQRVIRLGIGQLPLIEIGSIWKDGIRQEIMAGVSESFRNLEINSQTVNIISAGHKENGQSIIPYSHYRLGVAAGSKVVAIERDGDPYAILIPAMELIRFYYAVSTELSQAIFSGAFQHSRGDIIHESRTWYRESDDRVFLGLRQKITDEEGWVVARILRSPFAAKACRGIYDELLKRAISKKFINVSAGFPFEGSTNLKARIKPIPAENGSWRSLILSLEHCSEPMPYSELTIIRDNDGNLASPETDNPEEDKMPYIRGSYGGDESDGKNIQSEMDTNANLSDVKLTLPTDRFTALTGRKPDKPTKEQCEYRSAGLSSKSFEVDALGTGKGGYGQAENKVQRVSVVVSHSEKKKAAAPSFELFRDAIESLASYPGVYAEIRLVSLSLAQLPLTKYARRAQWAYLDSKTKTRRSVIIADICFGECWFCLIEFQLRESESRAMCLLSSGNKKLLDEELYRILIKCSEVEGVWKNINARVELFPLNHTWEDYKGLAKKLALKVRSKDAEV